MDDKDKKVNPLTEAAERARQMHTVPEILQAHGVQVIHGRCKGICHCGEKLTAKASNELYFCFKCSVRMDVIDLTMFFNDCSFKEAVELLGGLRELTPEEKRKQEQLHQKHLAEQRKRKEFEDKFHYWNTVKWCTKQMLDDAPDFSLELAHWYAQLKRCDSEIEKLLENGPDNL